MAFHRLETAFNGPVSRMLYRIGPEGGQVKVLGKPGAQVFAKVGHGIEGVGLLLPKPFIDLFGPEAFVAQFLYVTFQLTEAQLPDVLFYRIDHFAKVTVSGWFCG